ncbi:MAG: cobyrinate a,c-diamide synthase, partial [Bacillota bacterium]
FLKAASGNEAGNLDLHLQGQEGLKQAFSLAEGDFCVIESAMGYFDGLANTYLGSSYDIGRILGINTVLVYTPQAEMFTAIPKIKGMAEFKESSIKGVIFNRVSKKYYRLLKEQVENFTDLKVLGYLPPLESAGLKSRHLGLVQSVEIEELDQLIAKIAAVVKETIDLEELKTLTSDVQGEPFPSVQPRNLQVAVARDKAFSFYYRENLKLLEECCRVKYFSPLTDQYLPQCDLLYLGGGYPEVFRQDLAANRAMLRQVKSYAEQGGCTYAECGGMLYLNKGIEESAMCGIFQGESRLTDRLQRFGYIEITLQEDCLLGRAGDKLTAHEFHKSVCFPGGKEAFSINKAMGEGGWTCGYRYKNVLAGYPHINFLGNLNAFQAMLDYTEQVKKQ